MANTVEGIYLGAGKTQMFGKNNDYAVRKFWVDTSRNPEYPSPVEFQLAQDNCVKVDNIKPNQRVEVAFNLEGRKWEKDGKSGVMNTIKAYKIDIIEKRSAVVGNQAPSDLPSTGDDDLPF